MPKQHNRLHNITYWLSTQGNFSFKEIILFLQNNEITSYFFWRRKRSKKTFFSGKVLMYSINPRSAMPLATEGTQEPLLH